MKTCALCGEVATYRLSTGFGKLASAYSCPRVDHRAAIDESYMGQLAHLPKGFSIVATSAPKGFTDNGRIAR